MNSNPVSDRGGRQRFFGNPMMTSSFRNAGLSQVAGNDLSTSRPKVVYVLGLAYSGSTLFGLCLGDRSEIRTLGEAINLESDYWESGKCSCGSDLGKCAFWTVVRKHLDRRPKSISERFDWELNGDVARHPIDRRGGFWSKIQVVMGIPLPWIFGNETLRGYRQKAERLFEAATAAVRGNSIIVDLSKTPERLEILKHASAIDLKVIYLKRAPEAVLASTLKRPKRTRRLLGPKILRETLWQFLRTRHCERVLQSVPPEDRRVVSWEDFVRRPHEHLRAIDDWLGLDRRPRSASKRFEICVRSQHLFVGNRWLANNTAATVELRGSEDPALPPGGRRALALFFRTDRPNEHFGPSVSWRAEELGVLSAGELKSKSGSAAEVSGPTEHV